MKDAGHILTGATFRNPDGIFAYSCLTVDFEGREKTFTFKSIDRLVDTLPSIAEKVKERSEAIIAWTMEERFEILECDLA